MYLLATMCADMLHHGHITFLKTAKRIADEKGLLLLVGIHDDETICSYKRVPILTQVEREPVVSAIKYVDKVVTSAPLYITKEYMEKNDISCVIHAHDANDTSYDDAHEYPIKIGKFIRVDYTQSISTTDIIERCTKSLSLEKTY